MGQIIFRVCGDFVSLAIFFYYFVSCESSRPREPPTQSLTQPDVNLSVHPAPIDQSIVALTASVQTGKASD